MQRLEIEPEGTGGGLLQLSWFVEDVAPLTRALPTEMLDLFQRTIPEVLPRRYGLWEPPQFKLATDGIDHLRDFLAKNLRNVDLWLTPLFGTATSHVSTSSYQSRIVSGRPQEVSVVVVSR